MNARIPVVVLDAVEGAAADGLAGDDPKDTSTRLSQDPDVGVKCSVMRRFCQPRSDLGVLVGVVVVAHHLQLSTRIGARHGLEEVQELGFAVPVVAAVDDMAVAPPTRRTRWWCCCADDRGWLSPQVRTLGDGPEVERVGRLRQRQSPDGVHAMPSNGSSIRCRVQLEQAGGVAGRGSRDGSGSRRRVPIWNGPRATTVREKPDAERVQHRPGARQVAERGHAEVQRPELLGHILPGGILCGEPGQVDRNFRRSSPFVYTSAQYKHPRNGLIGVPVGVRHAMLVGRNCVGSR